MGQQIVGIGTDLVEIAQLEKTIAQFKERFFSRIYLPKELAYCQQMKQPLPHYAARFAAKEAVSKAFGTGIGEEIGWQDIEIARNKQTSTPEIILHNKGQKLAAARGVKQIFLSLSHTTHYAVAHVVLTT